MGGEKAQHFGRGIGAVGVGVGSAWVAARPRMAGFMYDPELRCRHAVPAKQARPGECVSARNSTRLYGFMDISAVRQPRGARIARRWRINLSGIPRAHGGVCIAVKDNDWSTPCGNAPVEWRTQAAVLHQGERRGEIDCDAVRYA
jgi:hypothetical protein